MDIISQLNLDFGQIYTGISGFGSQLLQEEFQHVQDRLSQISLKEFW